VDPLLHDIPEAGRLLHCGRTTVYELIRGGQLRTIKVGRRTLIPHSSLLEFIDRAEVKSAS
jgi:excisionase family DNA binding protein